MHDTTRICINVNFISLEGIDEVSEVQKHNSSCTSPKDKFLVVGMTDKGSTIMGNPADSKKVIP